MPENLQAALAKYGDNNVFLLRFNPSRQVEFCEKYLDGCFSGNAPTLRGLAAMYSPAFATSWIEIQIKDLMEYAGVKEKLSISQIENLADVIRVEFFYLKFTELMVFFHWFKAGRYGRFYGAVDGLVIIEALREFMADRHEKMRQIERNQKSECDRARLLKRQDMERRGLLIPLNEWNEIRWLFNM